MLGGSGAGLMAADRARRAAFAVAARSARLALIAIGLTAVWLEIGKQSRALHVLFNPYTSWMARESFAALLLFPLALGSILTLRLIPAAAMAALVFLWCQARILRARARHPGLARAAGRAARDVHRPSRRRRARALLFAGAFARWLSLRLPSRHAPGRG